MTGLIKKKNQMSSLGSLHTYHVYNKSFQKYWFYLNLKYLETIIQKQDMYLTGQLVIWLLSMFINACFFEQKVIKWENY